MSESVPAQSPPEGEAQGSETFDAEYVAKLRKEAAKYRTEAKANAEAAQRLAEFEKVNQTAEQRIAALEAQLSEAAAKEQRAKLVASIATAHKITDPEDIALFLTGADEDTLTAQAKRLASRDDARRKAGDVVPDAGKTPTNPGDSEVREFARQLFEKE